jgi:hypothetical protein
VLTVGYWKIVNSHDARFFVVFTVLFYILHFVILIFSYRIEVEVGYENYTLGSGFVRSCCVL